MPRIYMEFRQTRTATGRLSSAKPRSGAAADRHYIQGQNIPVRTADGRRIRGGFIARPGCLLGSWDLSQIEWRVLAHLSGDANLRGVFERGEDLHVATASRIWNIPLSVVTPAQRQSAKNIGFAMGYRVTKHGIKQQFALRGIEITLDEAEMFRTKFLASYPGIEAYWESVFMEVRRHGYLRCPSGRLRWLRAVHSTAEWVREEALRQAANAPVQEFAGWILKRAQARVWAALQPLWARGVYVECVLPIHDELIFEFERGIERELDALVRGAMTGAVSLAVPIECSGHWAERWDQLKD